MTRSSGYSDGLVKLDPHKVEPRMLRLGLSKTALAKDAHVSRNTVIRIFHGKGVLRSSALLIAKCLECQDVRELLIDPIGDALGEAGGSETSGGEWLLQRWITPWITASNGLQFRVCRMTHRLLSERQGRGKCYDLQHQSTALQDQLREHLLRHPRVSERIGPHPHLAENLSVAPGDRPGLWWVVDRWVEGKIMEECLRDGPYPEDRLPRLMWEIADGLHALHRKDVVFRELAPRRVLVEDDTGRALLTDFELAKLLGNVPTVSADWPDDPYRAPEVETGSADKRADLYSWARILVHAALGRLPAIGEDAESLSGIELPRALKPLVCDCLSPAPSDRPGSLDKLLRPLHRWAEKT